MGLEANIRIGEYVVHRRLGQGGMGEVWLVSNPLLRRLEVIKIIEAQAAGLPAARSRFLREGSLMAQIHHPNIVVLYDAGETPTGGLYLSMEHIRGRTLAQILRRVSARHERFPEGLVGPVVQSICQALAALHDMMDNGRPLNLVHRDISPQNVMIDYDGRVKVLDLGVAQVKGQDDLTKTGAVLGKPGYMSPEQAAGEALDGRSDLFSLGSLLYELLTHKRLFSKQPLKALFEISEGEGRQRVAADPHVPEKFRELLHHLLAPTPQERFSSAREVQSALVQIDPTPPEAKTSELAVFMKENFPQELEDSLEEVQSIAVTFKTPSPLAPPMEPAALAASLTQLGQPTPPPMPPAPPPPPSKWWMVGFGAGLGIILLSFGVIFFHGMARDPMPPTITIVRTPGASPSSDAPIITPRPVSTQTKLDAEKPASERRKKRNKRRRKKRRKPPPSTPVTSGDTPTDPRRADMARARRYIREDRLDDAANLILQLAKAESQPDAIDKCVRAALLVEAAEQMQVCLSKLKTE